MSIEGKIVALEIIDRENLALKIQMEDAEIKEVEYPFIGNSLSLITLQLTLLNMRVRYDCASKSSFDFDEPSSVAHSSSATKYSLEVLDGPLKGQVYEDTVFSR